MSALTLITGLKNLNSDFSNNKILKSALSFCGKYENKVFVIKYGGAAMTGSDLKDCFAKDIVALNIANIKTVIIHGGGKEITELSDRLNIPVEFVDGLRYTDSAVMEVVKMTLAGKINKDIVSNINRHKGNAAGFCGIDACLFNARKLIKANRDLGFVGEIIDVNTDFLNLLLSAKIIPVIAPIGANKNGESFNVNADNAASAVACALRAEKLVYISDVPGIMVDGELIKTITLTKAHQMIEQKLITNGMIPKMKSAFEAIKSGVRKVHLIDGRKQHSLLNEIFSDAGIGTEIIGSPAKSKSKTSFKKSGKLKEVS